MVSIGTWLLLALMMASIGTHYGFYRHIASIGIHDGFYGDMVSIGTNGCYSHTFWFPQAKLSPISQHVYSGVKLQQTFILEIEAVMLLFLRE